MHPPLVQPLPSKSGALQGALAIEYPFEHPFESLHIVYDGVNGQLPNLDLFNTAVSIAGGQMGIGANLQEMWNHDDSYKMRLQTILRGMVKQGLGYATGVHSSFMPYHIDAITLQTRGHGWQDEMALGRTVESLCRSLNNLLEHLHQSFFFYLLMQANRFVSIGTYLPSAMLIAGNFTVMAIALWMRSGYQKTIDASSNASAQGDEKRSIEGSGSQEKSGPAGEPSKEETEENGIMERQLALPLTLVIGLHFLGLIPLYIFNNLPHQVSRLTTLLISQLLPLHIIRQLTASAVLHLRHPHLCRHQRPPPVRSRSPPKARPSPCTNSPAVPSHQVILAPPPRPLLVGPRDLELLSLFHGRSALRPAELYRPAPKLSPDRSEEICSHCPWPYSHKALPARGTHGCMLVRGGTRVDGPDPGCVRVDRVGDVDAGGGLVCLVAGMAQREFAAGLLDILKKCFHQLERTCNHGYLGARSVLV